MDAWLPLIATILGAGIATGRSYFVMRRQFQYQTSEEKRKYHLQKLEMTYEAVTEMRRLYSETFGHMASITLLQKFRDWKERIILPIEKLTMLITLYSPELVPRLNSIESLRETLGKKLLNV